jgi:hypothetical protein
MTTEADDFNLFAPSRINRPVRHSNNTAREKFWQTGRVAKNRHLVTVIDKYANELEQGAIISIGDQSIRVRCLPILPSAPGD